MFFEFGGLRQAPAALLAGSFSFSG